MATSAKEWQKVKGEELELPSGNVALVRRPGPETLLRKGVLPDAMASKITEMIRSGKGMRPEDAKEMAESPEAILDMMDAMDRVMCQVVIQPHVLYHRGVKTENLDRHGRPVYRLPDKGEKAVDIPDDDRDPEALYSDEVDFEDKSFLFNFAVGGTRDIARFRRDSRISLGDVPDEPSDVDASVDTAGN